MYEEGLLVPVYVDLAPEEEVERRPRGIPPRYLKAWSQEAGERALAQDGYWEPEDLVRRMTATLQAFSHAVTEYDAVYVEVDHVPLGMGSRWGVAIPVRLRRCWGGPGRDDARRAPPDRGAGEGAGQGGGPSRTCGRSGRGAGPEGAGVCPSLRVCPRVRGGAPGAPLGPGQDLLGRGAATASAAAAPGGMPWRMRRRGCGPSPCGATTRTRHGRWWTRPEPTTPTPRR